MTGCKDGGCRVRAAASRQEADADGQADGSLDWIYIEMRIRPGQVVPDPSLGQPHNPCNY